MKKLYYAESNFYFRSTLILILILTISFCAPQVKMYKMIAAPYSLPGVKTIAVKTFEGRYQEYGIRMAEKISDSLTNAGHFTIVDRAQLEKVLSEQRLSLSGLADSDGDVKVGKLLNADAILTGTISSVDVKDFDQTRESKKRGRYKVFFREVHVRVDVMIILTNTGRKLRTFQIQNKQGDGKEDPEYLKNRDTLFDECAFKISQEIQYQICPSMQAITLKYDKGKGTVRDELKSGIEYAKNKLLDRALESFKQVSEQNPEASSPIYNQSVVLFLLGHLDESEILINKAIDLHQKSKIEKNTALSLSSYVKLLDKINEERRNQSKLEDQKAMLEDEKPAKTQFESRPSFQVDSSWRQKVKIAVVIPEVLLRRQVPDPAGETKIIQTLINAGFRLLEQTSISSLRYTPEIAAAIKDATLAATIARKLKVDAIIIGEAFGEEAGESSGFHNWRARLEARAIFTDTQDIICAVSEYGSGADIADSVAGKKALENAGRKVGEILVEKLDEYHRKKAGLTQRVRALREDAKIVKIISKSANIRMEPNTASAVVGKANLGESLKVLDRNKDWLYIQKYDGLEGWIHSSLVKGSK